MSPSRWCGWCGGLVFTGALIEGVTFHGLCARYRGRSMGEVVNLAGIGGERLDSSREAVGGGGRSVARCSIDRCWPVPPARGRKHGAIGYPHVDVTLK